MWDEHLARRVNGELHADYRLYDPNYHPGREFDNDDHLFEHNDDLNLDDHVLDALHQLDRVDVVRLQVLEKGTQRPFVALI